MRIIILGADGYIGWPLSLSLAQNHGIVAVDCYAKRRWEDDIGIRPLARPATLATRPEVPNVLVADTIDISRDSGALYRLVEDIQPDAIVHLAEQPSAPYSMSNRARAVETWRNNCLGTLNVAWAIREWAPQCHLVKLGTMGSYGTPPIPIEEGWLLHRMNEETVARLPFPKLPGSIYHASKVADSHLLELLTRSWGLRVTDLNQGIVFGTSTTDTAEWDLRTSFHYDAVFGTALNRFVTQAVLGTPLTVYGGGGQVRTWISLSDSIRCITHALENPPEEGTFRVFNQFSSKMSIRALASLVQGTLPSATIANLPNPRGAVEQEDHFYEPKADGLQQLGWEPDPLHVGHVAYMIAWVRAAQERGYSIQSEYMAPTIAWR